MTFSSFLLFIPSILMGNLIVHLLWGDKHPLRLLYSISLGIGIGLGINSILYFLSLLIASGKINILPVQAVLIGALLTILFLRKHGASPEIKFSKLTWEQFAILSLVFMALVFSVITFINIYDSRPQGAFDAWSIWNRAARFIYRDPENWRATLSPDLHVLTHTDYPLLVPLNVAWEWKMLGVETQRAPMAQGFLFLLASMGAMFSAVALRRTIGQAGLALLVLIGTPSLISLGAALISDLPVTYFIFISSVSMFFYFERKEPALLILSGFAAGLAGWSKNEGMLYIAISTFILILMSRKEMTRTMAWYLMGLAIPLAIIAYFKSITPPTDLFTGSGGEMLSKITDTSRYWMVAKAIGGQLYFFGDFWPVSIIALLAVYGFVMRTKFSADSCPGLYAITAILVLQFLGYCAIYILTPNDLEWHLATSLSRLLFHLYPTSLFLFFNVISPPEEAFSK